MSIETLQRLTGKKKKNRERERSVLLPFNFFFLVIETLNYDHNVEVLT
jgi:hypothetical protein